MRLLIGFLIPLKGVIAGVMSGGIVGRIFFVAGGLEALSHAHLLILGLSWIAGYREQVLQRIIRYGSHHADSVR